MPSELRSTLKSLWCQACVVAVVGVCALPTAHAQTYTVTTLAGSSATVIRSIDATGASAQFYRPQGIAVGADGTLYVADTFNHSIRKVTAAGVVTTLAGSAGTSGYANGTGSAALFHEPWALAVDSAGMVYVSDTNNHSIRKITPAGVVTTLAGNGSQGSTDGTGSVARFREPHGIALDSSGNVYVADYENTVIRKITSSGVVTTLAGSVKQEGSTDGTGTAARFKGLQGLVVDSAGNVYVADAGNRSIRKISPSGVVTTLTTNSGSALSQSRGLAINAAGTAIFVADSNSNVIQQVSTSTGAVTTVAGVNASAGSTDGATSAALFNGPYGVAGDSAGTLYVADSASSTIRKIASNAVTTLAGLAGRSSSADGDATAARFEDPYSVAVAKSGNLYVTDATDHSIRKITPSGIVTTLAGKAGTFGSADGTGNTARFKGALGIAVDDDETVYVADTGNATIRKISSAGVVTTLAGQAGFKGGTDGTGTAARFSDPYGVAVDSNRNVYVADSTSVVRKISPSGVVTTLAGTMGMSGLVDANGTAARFSVLFDLAADSQGNVYVSDHGNHVVRKVTSAGMVTTLAGNGTAGKTNGTGSAASFQFPSGVAVDSAGVVYLADTDNQVIRRISATGEVTNFLGSGLRGAADGTGTTATFTEPKDVAVDVSGNLYIVDRGNRTIRKALVQTATAPPNVPEGLAATVASTSSIGLSWTASSGAGVISYKIYRGGTLVATVATTGLIDTGLAAATTYGYTVSACDAAGNCSAQSSSVAATTTVASSASKPATLAIAGANYVFDVPYLEFTANGTRQAVSIQLISSDLSQFSLVADSVKSMALRAAGATGPVAILALATSGFRLNLPYFEFTSGCIRSAYSVALTTTDLATFTVQVSTVASVVLVP